MEEHLHHDDMEELFRKSLNQQGEESEDGHWDLPPDDLWDKIQPRIPPPPKRPYRRWLLGTALVVVAIILYLLRTCNSRPAHPVAAEGLPSATEQSPSAKHSPAPPSLAETSTERVQEERDMQRTTSDIKADGIEGRAKTVLPSIRSRKVATSTVKEQSTSPGQNLTKSTIPTQPILPKATGLGTLTTLTALPLFAESTKKNQLLSPPVSLPVDTGEGTGRKGAFYAGLYFAPALSYRIVREPQQRFRGVWNDQEQPDNTFAAGGLKLGYQLSERWALEIGAHYSRTSVRSSHRQVLNYDRQRERRNASGGYDSEYQMRLSTSFGEVETDVALSRAASTTIPLNTPTLILFDLEQEFSYLRIPVIASYRMGQGRLKMALRAGLGANFLVDKELTVNQVRSNRTGLKHRRTDITDKFKGLDNMSFDALFGVGLDYALTPHFSLILEPTFIQSLQATYQLDRSRTYPYIISLNIGGQYYF